MAKTFCDQPKLGASTGSREKVQLDSGAENRPEGGHKAMGYCGISDCYRRHASFGRIPGVARRNEYAYQECRLSSEDGELGQLTDYDDSAEVSSDTSRRRTLDT
jgi:hypothetical protein